MPDIEAGSLAQLIFPDRDESVAVRNFKLRAPAPRSSLAGGGVQQRHPSTLTEPRPRGGGKKGSFSGDAPPSPSRDPGEGPAGSDDGAVAKRKALHPECRAKFLLGYLLAPRIATEKKSSR